jgi:hypothetical protein
MSPNIMLDAGIIYLSTFSIRLLRQALEVVLLSRVMNAFGVIL